MSGWGEEEQVWEKRSSTIWDELRQRGLWDMHGQEHKPGDFGDVSLGPRERSELVQKPLSLGWLSQGPVDSCLTPMSQEEVE